MSQVYTFFEDLFTKQLVLEYDITTGKSTRLMATMTYSLPITAVLLYLAMVFILPRFIKKPIEFPFIWNMWNLGLSILSFFIVLGVGIPWFTSIYQRGIFQTVCDPQKHLYQGATPLLFWSYIFALSKYVELLDTLFVVLKNPDRPVLFLHWYHHTTVLLFTWFAEYLRFSVGFVFIVVNAMVHTFMYYYYYQTGRGKKPSWAFWLTLGQISQMFLGIAANGYWLYNHVHGHKCGCDSPEIIVYSCAVMYGSYLILFLKFFAERYLFSAKKPGGPKKDD